MLEEAHALQPKVCLTLLYLCTVDGMLTASEYDFDFNNRSINAH